MDVETAPSSGDPETDSLVERRWITAGAPITFSFPAAAAQFTGYTDGEPFSNFEGLNATQQTAARTILASVSSFTNLVFSELTGADAANAMVRFGMTDVGDTAHAYLPSASERAGDVWFNNTSGEYDNPVRGNYEWFTIAHEVGHALGLGHPHESTPPMSRERDSMAYTVMSYRSFTYDDIQGYGNATWGFAQSYMVEDVAALQFLYGANFNYNSGNNLYTWSPTTGEMFIDGVGRGAPGANVIFLTVWDGSGIDTFDLSNHVVDTSAFHNPTYIDLRPGEGSLLQGQRADLGVGPFAYNFFVAQLYNGDTRSLIENAIGTNGQDVIRGNDAANHLDGNGGGGFDELYGFGGDDVLVGGGFLFGGDGNDTLSGGGSLYGGMGNDQLFGADARDFLEGNEGDDTLFAAGGDDSVKGHAGLDILYGEAGNDTLEGGEDVDALYGSTGNDFLYGGAGDDTLTGGEGDDTLDGGDGGDVLAGGLGNDTYTTDGNDQVIELAGEGIDTIQTGISLVAPSTIENLAAFPFGDTALNLTGNALDNDLSGNVGVNILDGGAGADRLTGWSGDDTYYVDNPNDKVTEYAGGGTDTVYSSVSYVLASTPPPGTLPPGYDPYAGASLRNDPPLSFAVEILILTGTANLDGSGSEIANTIQGNSGDNLLNGNAGDDTLLGRAGADKLIGGVGADELVGGAGADTFFYDSENDSTAALTDWLSDFAHGADLIDMRSISSKDLTLEVFESGTPNAWTKATVTTYVIPLVLKIAGVATAADFLFADLTVTGTAAGEILRAGAGNDTLDGLTGADILYGFGGNDHYFVDNAADAVFEAVGGGTDRILASVHFTMSAGSEVEVLSTTNDAGTGAIDLRGNEFANSLLGNAGANSLDGGTGADILTGLAGNDFYFVDNAGDTVIEAVGGGSDRVFASVHYTLAAGAEVEILSTTNNTGADAINLTGNEFANLVAGNNGANILDGGAGADILNGLAGNDFYYVDNAGDVVLETIGNGSDRILSSVSYVLGAGAEVEILSTTNNAGTDAINLKGNEFANLVAGNNGANILDGGAGADTLNGLAGNDFYYVDNAGDVVLETIGNGSDRILSSVSYVLGAGAEVEILSTTNNTGTDAIDLTGNALVNLVAGNNGANLLDGGAGADTLNGLAGNDFFLVDNAGDVVIEAIGGGSDRIFASVSYVLGAGVEVEILSTTNNAGTDPINLKGNEFANIVAGNNGANLLDGGAGADTLNGLAGNDFFLVDNAADMVLESAGGGSDRIFASASFVLGAGAEVEILSTTNNTGTDAINLKGNEFANLVAGNNGANILDGGAGADILNGLAGNDFYYVDNAGDVVLETIGNGSDRILSSVSYVLGAGAEVEILSTTNNAGTDAINLKGNEFANLVAGNNGANILDGGAGADTLNGLAGNDFYYVDNAGDVVLETIGNGSDRILSSVSYVLSAGVEVEILSTTNNTGTDAIDLTGNEFANTLAGNDGANVLNGGGGSDILNGLGGADTYRFTTAIGVGNIDTILGYVVADDVIQLEDSLFVGLAAGALAAGAFNTGAAASEADDRIIYNSATGALLFDADGNGAGAALQFATLDGGLAITASEFFVI